MDYPRFENHFVPRTRDGRVALAAFLSLFALAEPPILYWLANRLEPWLLGQPFLYTYLFVVYAALILVLFFAHHRRL
ncbi:MAG TPA: hypothetical protein VLK65_12690 [Vicinamibacteria bacterium]|nr:hypothetical protein [Vicinamibacteria bacterium]